MVKEIKIKVFIKKAEEGGYYAYCPAFKGCFAQGQSMAELKRNVKSAIIEYMKIKEEMASIKAIEKAIKENKAKASQAEKKATNIAIPTKELLAVGT